jgi:hypothetical protein
MRESYKEAFGLSKTTDILSWAPDDVFLLPPLLPLLTRVSMSMGQPGRAVRVSQLLPSSFVLTIFTKYYSLIKRISRSAPFTLSTLSPLTLLMAAWRVRSLRGKGRQQVYGNSVHCSRENPSLARPWNASSDRVSPPPCISHSLTVPLRHDHETDEDWFRMTDREDEVLKELKQSFPKGLIV